MAKERSSEGVLIGIIVALVVVAVVAVVVAVSLVLASTPDSSPSPVTEQPATPASSSSRSSSSSFARESSSASAQTTYKQGTGSPAIVGSSASRALSEREAYELLLDYYELAGEYDKKVASCADDFTDYGLKEDKSARTTRASTASSLKQQVKSSWDDVGKVELPFMSKNAAALDDIEVLYECLWHRIDVIDRAWKISLTFDKPEEHKREVMEPITADQVNGANKYYTRFKELYPKVDLVKP